MARQDEPMGHLRIGAPDGFADRYVAPALATFLAAYPSVTAEIVEDIRFANLVEQRLDLTIRIVREPDDAAIVRRLGTSEVVICAAPELIERRGAPTHPTEIGNWPCVGFAMANWWREWRFEAPEALSIPIKPCFISNGTGSLRAAGVAGIGLTAIPRWAITDELAAGLLEVVLPDWKLMESGIYAVYPSNRLVTTKVRRFVDHLAPIIRRKLR
jgi:DNA-binding transcriptional LysR family regulator